MRRIKIVLPATISDFGPGLGGLGLALGLHTIVEITERTDDKLNVETAGEDAGRYAVGLRHPVVLGLIRIFQRLENTVLGLNIRIDNRIPHAAGLGVEAAYLIAGIIGANNLLGNTYKREDILSIAAQESRRPDQVTAAILGGLAGAILEDGELVYRSLPCAPLQVVVVAPDADDYADAARGMIPERVLLRDAVYNLARVPLLIDALREGDLPLLAKVAGDRLYAPYTRPLIGGSEAAADAARRAGAGAVLMTRGGALVAFTERNHAKIGEAMRAAFSDAGTGARSWALPVDRQGIVISVAQSSS
jgi:homoserine kinase